MNIPVAIMIVLCLIIAGLSLYREKNIFNPLTLFLGFWSFILILSLINQNTHAVKVTTYLYMTIGFLSFALGFYILKLLLSKKRTNEIRSYKFNYKVLYLLYAITFAILVYLLVNVIILLSQGQSLYSIRKSLFSDKTNVIMSVIQFYVIDTMAYILVICGVSNLYFGKNKKQIIIFTVIFILMVAFQNGGRLIIYRFAVDLVIGFLVYINVGKRSFSLDKKSISIVLASSILIIGVSVLITIMRKSSVRLIYDYFTGCINLLDYRLTVIDQQNQYTHGFSFFGGIIRPIFTLLNKAHIVPYPDLYLESAGILRDNVQQGVYFISPGIKYNAFVTPFLYFYLDLRIYGIIFGSMIYGGICYIVYRNILVNPNIKSISIFLLITQELFTSMIRWQFNVPSYAWGVIILLIGCGIFIEEKRSSDIQT